MSHDHNDCKHELFLAAIGLVVRLTVTAIAKTFAAALDAMTKTKKRRKKRSTLPLDT